MSKTRIRKASPLLLFAILSIAAFAVGAIVIQMWFSGPIDHSITVIGFDAVVISLDQTPTPGAEDEAYRVKEEATVLEDWGVFYDGVILCYLSGNIAPGEDLIISFDILESGVPTTKNPIIIGTVAAFRFDGGVLRINAYQVYTQNADGDIVIPAANIPDITWKPPDPSGTLKAGLILEFDFPSLYTGTDSYVYGTDIPFDITISAGIDV